MMKKPCLMFVVQDISHVKCLFQVPYVIFFWEMKRFILESLLLTMQNNEFFDDFLWFTIIKNQL